MRSNLQTETLLIFFLQFPCHGYHTMHFVAEVMAILLQFPLILNIIITMRSHVKTVKPCYIHSTGPYSGKYTLSTPL